MSDDFDDTSEKEIRNTLLKKTQRLRMRKQSYRNADFGMVASLGGVIIVPILLGILGGSWLDEHFPVAFSWRLSLLFLGFVWGMVNAYYWLKAENAKIGKNEKRKADFNKGEKNGQ